MYRHEPWMDGRIRALERGKNPVAIPKLKSGYAVMTTTLQRKFTSIGDWEE